MCILVLHRTYRLTVLARIQGTTGRDDVMYNVNTIHLIIITPCFFFEPPRRIANVCVVLHKKMIQGQ